MGRLSQMMAYLNADKHPTGDDIKHDYTHFTPDEDSKKVRRKHRSTKSDTPSPDSQ